MATWAVYLISVRVNIVSLTCLKWKTTSGNSEKPPQKNLRKYLNAITEGCCDDKSETNSSRHYGDFEKTQRK